MLTSNIFFNPFLKLEFKNLFANIEIINSAKIVEKQIKLINIAVIVNVAEIANTIKKAIDRIRSKFLC